MSFDAIIYRLQVCLDFSRHFNTLRPVQGFLPDLHGYTLTMLAEEGPGMGSIVEIGSFKGRSTCWLAIGSKRAGRERVFAVDHFTGSPEHQKGAEAEEESIVTKGSTFEEFQQNIRTMGVEDHVTAIVASSEEAVKTWSGPIRLLFIDGDHSYEASKKDFECWSPFVCVGGVVAFHDVGDGPGVTRFYQELLAERKEYVQVIDMMGLNVVLKTAQVAPHPNPLPRKAGGEGKDGDTSG